MLVPLYEMFPRQDFQPITVKHFVQHRAGGGNLLAKSLRHRVHLQ
jgi:hypothetical protein